MDWLAWHDGYDTHAGMAQRLGIVQRHVAEFVAASTRPEIRLVSMCAGDGRDVVGALRGHPRRGDVTGRLVELSPELVTRARASTADAGLRLEVLEADAALTDAYVGAVPADLLLACGVFGNISDDDVRATIDALPTMLAPGATVIWTRHRRPPDLTWTIREWFAAAGFREEAFEAVTDGPQAVGVHRLVASPRPLQQGTRLFTFIREA